MAITYYIVLKINKASIILEAVESFDY